jgi:acyl-homoserine-lactone acylase
MTMSGAVPHAGTTGATIHRDTYGVPHVYGVTEEDAFYALAWAMCEDGAERLFLNLRIGIGRGAEVPDGGGELWAEPARVLRIEELAQREWDAAAPQVRRDLVAFAEGLEAYRAAFPGRCGSALPADPLQVVAFGRLLFASFSYRAVIAKAQAALEGTDQPIYATDQSNSWALAGSRTASGKPMLLIDPHWDARGPLALYEAHVHGGDLDCGGFMPLGYPFLALGYTPGVAWTLTAGGADSVDAYELKLHPEDPDRYWYDGSWRRMQVWEGTRRALNPEGDLAEAPYRVRHTVHGPVILEDQGRAFAGAMCDLENDQVATQFYRMGMSRNADALREALRMDQLAWFNLTYATAEGHIGYLQTGSCPLRPVRLGGMAALDGTTSASRWQGRVPADGLPQVHDPETGWLQNCNTAANVVTDGLSMTREDFPPGALFGHYGDVWRGRGTRARQMLRQAEGYTMEDGQALAFDTLALAGLMWRPPLVEGFRRFRDAIDDPPDELDAALDAVLAWDARMEPDSVGATILRTWRGCYGRRHPEVQGDAQMQHLPASDEELRDAALALAEAVRMLQEHHGTALVPWGQIHRLQLADVDLAVSGDEEVIFMDCLRATGPGILMDEEGMVPASRGQVTTTLVSLSDPLVVWSVTPYGQSLDAASPHYTDQMAVYASDRLRPAWHTWEQLQGHIESSTALDWDI